ncbi:UNVERIFIED_CONTAM: TonB-dependent receptor [Methylobacteriaceae bacterium AG10]|nr:TonB-dependent receptor [Methylobacteriaceae bacterium AG10]
MVKLIRGGSVQRLALAGASLIAMNHALASQEQGRELALLGVGHQVSIVPGTLDDVSLPRDSSTDRVRVSIASGPLDPALQTLAKQAAIKIAYETALTADLVTPGVEGEFGPLDALAKLLEGTGLAYRSAGSSTITLVNPRYVQLGASSANTVVTLEELSVTAQGPDLRSNQVPPRSTIGQPQPAYAGGQVATGSQIGVLGNKDFLSTPFTANSYTDKLIRDQQALTIGDIATNDPSVRQVRGEFDYQDFLFIRGLPVVSRNFAFAGLYGISDQRRPSLEGVERVEVLHGPAAFLFGFAPAGNNIGGVVNLVPKRAGDVPLTRATGSFLSSGNGGGSFDIGRRFGDGNAAGVRINGYYRDGAVPVDNINLRSGGITLGADWRGDSVRVSLDAGFQHNDISAPIQGIAVSPGIRIPRAPNITRNPQQPYEFTDTTSGFGLLKIEYDFSDNWTAFGSIGGSFTDNRFLNGSYTLRNTAGLLTGSAFGADETQAQISGEIGIKGNIQTGPISHAITLAGTDYISSNPFSSFGPINTINLNQSNLYSRVFTPIPAYFAVPRARYGTEAEFSSFVFSDTMTIIPDVLDLISGVRLASVSSTSRNATTGAIAAKYNESYPTPLGAIVFKPLPWLSVYASYAEALSLGPTAPANAANPNQVFPPIVSRQIEGGIKADFGMIGASLAVYNISQPQSFLNPATRIFGLIGEQVNDGIDINIFGEPIDGVRLIGGVSYLNGVLTRTAGGVNDGNQAPGVPHWQVSIAGEYDVPYVLGLTTVGRVIYTSRQFYDVANTQTIPDWVRVDLGARYTFLAGATKMNARFNVENVAGINYWQSAALGSLYLGTPRTFKLSLSAEF